MQIVKDGITRNIADDQLTRWLKLGYVEVKEAKAVELEPEVEVKPKAKKK